MIMLGWTICQMATSRTNGHEGKRRLKEDQNEGYTRKPNRNLPVMGHMMVLQPRSSSLNPSQSSLPSVQTRLRC